MASDGTCRPQGYRVRIYLPFGREWFPYFMRRLGERPANVLFIIRSLLHERRSRPKAMGTSFTASWEVSIPRQSRGL